MTESEDYPTKRKADLVRQADRALAARSSDLVLRGLQLAQELDTAAAGGEPAAEERRRRAEQGDADAQFELGVHHILGEGVQKNPTLGVQWLRKAAEQGHAAAQYSLGRCYAAGKASRRPPLWRSSGIARPPTRAGMTRSSTSDGATGRAKASNGTLRWRPSGIAKRLEGSCRRARPPRDLLRGG